MTFEGITVPFLWGYTPETSVAIKWVQSGNGNWTGSDRGAGEDVYETTLSFKGTFAELTSLDTVLNDNRENFDITCGTGEEIFGADIDYSSPLDVVVVKYGEMSRVTYSSYTRDLTLRLLSPTFQTITPSLSSLMLKFQYVATSEVDTYNQFTYDGIADYKDHGTDPGIFEAVFRQTNDEMKAIRRYLTVTCRNSTVAFPAIEDYPFGPNADVGPFSVKIIEWEDMGRSNLQFWNIRIKMARIF